MVCLGESGGGMVGQIPLRILWDMVNVQAVRILLECILVLSFMKSSQWNINLNSCEKKSLLARLLALGVNDP